MPIASAVAFGNGLYYRNWKQTRTPLKRSFHLGINPLTHRPLRDSHRQNFSIHQASVELLFSALIQLLAHSYSALFFFSTSLISRNVENLPKLLSHLWNFLPVFTVFLIFLHLYVLYLNVYVNFVSSVVLGSCWVATKYLLNEWVNP